MEKKMQKIGAIKQTVYIDAPPEKVYNAFIDSKIHSKFTGSKATGGKIVGSKITAWDGYITGKNIKLQKGKLIVQEWRTDEFPEGYGSSSLKLEFKKKGKGTELKMTHTKVPMAKLKDFASGWKEYYWKPLKKYFDSSD